MSYCPKCGREVEVGATFCPGCGTNLKDDMNRYQREPNGWNAGRIFMILFGALFLIVSLGLLAGGGALVTMENAFSDVDGYLISSPIELTTNTYALVSPSLDLDINIPNSWAIPTISEWISVKIIAESKYSSKPLFVGIATSQNLRSYLDGVAYEEVTKIRWDYDPSSMGDQNINYHFHNGDAPRGPPIYEDFWEASDYGTRTVEFTWTPNTGDYVLVSMNNDGSSDIDADIRFGIRLPAVLKYIGYGLMSGGIIALIVGLFLLNTARK
jgi:hypothetical protein